MPNYHYVCAACGVFEAWRPMAEAAAPHPCPDCDAQAPRGVARPYTRNSIASLRYMAESRNEKSAHEPMLERRLKAGTGSAERMDRATNRKPASHVHRPWMIGH